jgi:hypothetical protein
MQLLNCSHQAISEALTILTPHPGPLLDWRGEGEKFRVASAFAGFGETGARFAVQLICYARLRPTPARQALLSNFTTGLARPRATAF